MNKLIFYTLLWSTTMMVAACTFVNINGDNNNLTDDSTEGAVIINTEQSEDN